MDQAFIDAIAPVWADSIEEKIATIDDAPDAFKATIQKLLDARANGGNE